MSTFLQLCQATARECGIAGGADASPRPTTTVGQAGESNRLVNWVIDAYIELQESRNWRWMRKNFTFETVASTQEYSYSDVTDVDTATAITRFDSWYTRMPAKIYLTSDGVNGQRRLIWMPWNQFDSIYNFGAMTGQTGVPVYMTINPQDELVLGPTPNDAYTVTGDYYRSAQVLAADADVPELPSSYHNIIMYRAMEFYGLYESAPEIISRGTSGYKRRLNQLKRTQETPFGRGGPLA